ncbi:hypothetical protein ILYODFUR_017878 [Ilyodon furcidens]|uniref:Uncharacterized protein n=1 Tax=Ilyodon furcidens TaxID=33524 RepID=A0ABV0TW06_9TELE
MLPEDSSVCFVVFLSSLSFEPPEIPTIEIIDLFLCMFYHDSNQTSETFMEMFAPPDDSFTVHLIGSGRPLLTCVNNMEAVEMDTDLASNSRNDQIVLMC